MHLIQPGYMNFAAFVVPAFLLFVGLEYWQARRKGRGDLYVYESSVSNMSIGIAERLLSFLITGSFYALFVYIYDHFRLFTIPTHWAVWVLLILATDLVWYWYHRFGHQINLFWAAHIVHHQSEEFNYTTSARITIIQAIVRNLFWCILPFIGFSPVMVTTILVVHGAYAFFTHTQLIGKLGWLEHILITPSLHGVHHASNEKYLNKNYGDIFVFWDKAFGTFQAEEEKPIYGLTHPLKSHSFLWQHFHYFMELIEACRRSRSFFKSLQIIFGRPENVDQQIRGVLEKRWLPGRKLAKSSFRFKVYVNMQLVASLTGLFFFTLYFKRLDQFEIAFQVGLILFTLINCGALLEQQRWIYPLEIFRMILFFGFISYLQHSPLMFMTSLILILIVTSFETVERWYYKLVYDS